MSWTTQSRVIGIVLAAGDATRMPGKPLLPRVNAAGKLDGVMIESAVDYCIRFGCKEVIVVQPKNAFIELVLEASRPTGASPKIQYHMKETPRGVVDAIISVIKNLPVRESSINWYLVTFADNWYDSLWDDPLTIAKSAASVKRIDALEEAHRLDAYSSLSKMWVTREDAHDLDKRLAGWCLLRHSDLVAHAKYGQSLVELLNHVKAEPVEQRATDHWYDVGTPEGYFEYLVKELKR